jgi:hypothetical protein
MRLVAGALIAVLAATATAAPKKPVPKKLLRYADTIGVKDLERREKPREGAIETYLGRYREGGALLPSARRPALRDGDKLFLHVLPGGTMRVESRRHATNGKRHVHRLDGSYRGLEAGTWWPFVAADLGLEMSGGGFYRPEVPGGLADHGPILRGIVRDPAALTRAGIAGVRAGHRIELERPAGRETDWKLRILEVAARVSPRSGPLSERGGLGYLLLVCSDSGMARFESEKRHERVLHHARLPSGRFTYRIRVSRPEILRATEGLADLGRTRKDDLLHLDLEVRRSTRDGRFVHTWRVLEILLLRPIADHPTVVRVRMDEDGRVRAYPSK